MRKEGVLLRPIEAVDLVAEKHRAATQRATSFGFFDDFTDSGNAVDDGAELHELPVGVLGDQACDRRLPAAGWAPEDAAADITAANGVAPGTPRMQEIFRHT